MIKLKNIKGSKKLTKKVAVCVAPKEKHVS